MEQFPTQRQEYATPDQSELAGFVNGIFHEHPDTVGIWIPDRPEVPIHTMLVGRLEGDQIPHIYQNAWIAIGQLHLPAGTEVTTVAIKSVNQEDGNVMIRIIDGVPQYINKRPVQRFSRLRGQ